QFLTLTCTFMVMSFISLMAYAYLARSAQTWFSNDNRVNWFNRTTGGGFILIGLGLLRLKSV
ncbi:MAG: LysE family translocator, partial [Gammaproteobacteria bacterium]|nr:LysE family translocator [Gammaproteobacteria bacterium]